MNFTVKSHAWPLRMLKINIIPYLAVKELLDQGQTRDTVIHYSDARIQSNHRAE